MAERLIRIGRISSVNADNGMVKVTYPDLDDAVTAEIPLFSFTGEYKMPAVGAEVVVLHLSSGETLGIALGTYWNDDNRPPVSSGFRKELGGETGEAYLQYDDGILTIKADTVRITGELAVDGSISAGRDIRATGDIQAGGNIQTDGGNVIAGGDIACSGEVSGSTVFADGDVTGSGKSLAGHTHTDSIGGSTSGPN